jgi:dihydrolipoamide dehydrogenase
MATRNVQTLVLGAGPGGYVAAIRAAQLGRKVTVVEREFIGGVCLNVGCIPSKAMIHGSTVYDRIQHAAEMGIEVSGARVDLGKLVDWKAGVVSKLTGGIGQLFKAHKIETVMGTATFKSQNSLEVKSSTGTDTLVFEECVIATGSSPIQLKGFEIDGKLVMGSTEALACKTLPKRVVVLGGGYIGLEIGTMWRKLGSEVTVVELMPTILTGIEKDCARVVHTKLKKRNVNVMLETKAIGLEKKANGCVVHVEGKGGTKSTIECDVVLATIGRRPNSANLGLEAIGVKIDPKGFIVTDDQMKTAVKGIYAIGDVAGQPMLAHKASYEGIVAAEVIAGKKRFRDWKCVPAVVFTDPEIGSVGLTEEDCAAKGIEVLVGKFPMGASGRALSLGEAEGFTKVVADKKTGVVLGVHIVGPEASEIIAEGGLAIEMGATLEDLALTIHAHPTLPETIMEAAEAAMGHAIHMFQPKR